MTAIAATTGTYRSRVDGTLVIQIEIQPADRVAALELLGMPGTQVAIAALRDGSILEQKPDAVFPASGGVVENTSPAATKKIAEPPKTLREQIGDACLRTVQWCKDPQFWNFLNQHPKFLTGSNVTSTVEAADLVRYLCNVESRRELDTNNEANKAWHREIREPYRLWLLANGGQAA